MLREGLNTRPHTCSFPATPSTVRVEGALRRLFRQVSKKSLTSQRATSGTLCKDKWGAVGGGGGEAALHGPHVGQGPRVPPSTAWPLLVPA